MWSFLFVPANGGDVVGCHRRLSRSPIAGDREQPDRGSTGQPAIRCGAAGTARAARARIGSTEAARGAGVLLRPPVVDAPSAVAGELAIPHVTRRVGPRLPFDIQTDTGARRWTRLMERTGLAPSPSHGIHHLPFPLGKRLSPIRTPLRHGLRTWYALLGRSRERDQVQVPTRIIMRKKRVVQSLADVKKVSGSP
jgi:hypothetical protein